MVLVLANGLGADAPVTTVAPDNPHIGYMGRIAMVDGEARMGYPGVTIRFVYRGPAPVMRFTAVSPGCYFDLAVNGWQPVVMQLKKGANEVPLVSGRAPRGGWLVELVRRTESWEGVASFDGLELPAGCELLSPPAWPERKLMFIGDSITCGECIDLIPPAEPSGPTAATNDAPRAFGMLLGKELHAQVHLVSYGGRGVMRDWKGRTDTNNAPQFFPLALPDDPSIPWDPNRYQPDAIVICLGQNDFSSGLIDAAIYEKAYDDFLTQVRSVHPRAALLLVGSPMQGNVDGTTDRAKRDSLRSVLAAIVKRRRAAGEAPIDFVMPQHEPGSSANAHPTAFQQEQIAVELLAPLKKLTGW